MSQAAHRELGVPGAQEDGTHPNSRIICNRTRQLGLLTGNNCRAHAPASKTDRCKHPPNHKARTSGHGFGGGYINESRTGPGCVSSFRFGIRGYSNLHFLRLVSDTRQARSLGMILGRIVDRCKSDARSCCGDDGGAGGEVVFGEEF